jgi:hypothetical protein
VQQEKQLKKIAKSMGLKDIDPPSPFVQFMCVARRPSHPIASHRMQPSPLTP